MDIKSAFRTSLLALAGSLAVLSAAGSASAQSAERLAKADANGDGDIEWQEMLDMRASMFARLDRNGDGFADAADSPRIGPAKARFNQALETLQDADADKDGRISKTELLNAPAPLFENGDANGDKILSADEITALREAAPAN